MFKKARQNPNLHQWENKKIRITQQCKKYRNFYSIKYGTVQQRTSNPLARYGTVPVQRRTVSVTQTVRTNKLEMVTSITDTGYK
jgi:hypothetical protein